MRPLRAFTAGLGVETNTFSRLDVGMDDFRRTFLCKPSEHPDMLTEVSAPLHVLRRRRDEYGWTLVEGNDAFALTGGRTLRAAYANLGNVRLDHMDRTEEHTYELQSLTRNKSAG